MNYKSTIYTEEDLRSSVSAGYKLAPESVIKLFRYSTLSMSGYVIAPSMIEAHAKIEQQRGHTISLTEIRVTT